MKPMVLRSIPHSRNRKDNVPNTNKSGNPEENPRKNIRSAAGLRYGAARRDNQFMAKPQKFFCWTAFASSAVNQRQDRSGRSSGNLNAPNSDRDNISTRLPTAAVIRFT